MTNYHNVSVVVPVFNGETYLRTAINSILGQTYPVAEIFVVDGGSTDGTEAIARSFSQVVWLRQSGKGLSNARNTGIQATSGDLVAFLDHDDQWEPDKLAMQVEYLRHHPQVQYVITQLKFLLEEGCTPTAAYTSASFEQIHTGCTPSALLARRLLFEQLGGFNETFVVGGDADWFARARDAGISSALIPKVLTYKRIHESNLSSNVETNRDELIAIILQSLRRRRQHRKD